MGSNSSSSSAHRTSKNNAPVQFDPRGVASITTFLDEVYNYYHKEKFIGTDPITYPRNAVAKGLPSHEVEYIGFVAAMFAYGNVKAIQGFLENIFHEHGTDPFKISTNAAKLCNSNLYYRFQSSQDVANIVALIAKVYREHGTLEGLMNAQERGSGDEGSRFAKAKAGFNNHFRNNIELTGGVKMMFAQVERSAAKRLSMFLRWMIRDDHIDLGLWAGYSPQGLTIPLDVHITQFAKRINIIQNSNASKGNMVAVTSFFNLISPQDPAKYDFSLTRPGIIHNCTFTLGEKVCYNCPQHNTCKLISDVCS